MKRCNWAIDVPDIYISYHDNEWGIPEYDDSKLFEMLILEGMQAGLSWITILKKRDALRSAFAGFDPHKVRTFTDDTINSLLHNPAIIRNGRKCRSAVQNAEAFCRLQQEYGSFSSFIWAYVDNNPVIHSYTAIEEVPAHTPLSEKISRDLKAAGMNFVGPTIIYSFMQAIGMVNDHLTCCFKHPQNSGKLIS